MSKTGSQAGYGLQIPPARPVVLGYRPYSGYVYHWVLGDQIPVDNLIQAALYQEGNMAKGLRGQWTAFGVSLGATPSVISQLIKKVLMMRIKDF
jgi:hypothetical protein